MSLLELEIVFLFFLGQVDPGGFSSLFVNSVRMVFFAMAAGGTGLMTLMILLRYLLWSASLFGLEARAKKVLIELIIALQEKTSQSAEHAVTLTETALLNYNLSLAQLQNIYKGDYSDLELPQSQAVREAAAATAPESVCGSAHGWSVLLEYTCQSRATYTVPKSPT